MIGVFFFIFYRWESKVPSFLRRVATYFFLFGCSEENFSLVLASRDIPPVWLCACV
jgi:hypothetical protein